MSTVEYFSAKMAIISCCFLKHNDYLAIFNLMLKMVIDIVLKKIKKKIFPHFQQYSQPFARLNQPFTKWHHFYSS
jgi:hypothetical protein